MNLRRSTRLRDAEQTKAEHGRLHDQDDNSGTSEPLRKRVKMTGGTEEGGIPEASTSTHEFIKSKGTNQRNPQAIAPKRRKRAKKAGKLVLLLQMPLDVLYHILGYLEPLDLLRVSMLNKAFRVAVASRSARSVWITTLKYAHRPPPPCPEDMTEIGYIRMLYEPHCWFCNGLALRNSPWPFALRVRYCRSCAVNGDLFTPVYSANFSDLQEELLRLRAVPCSSGPDPLRSAGRYCNIVMNKTLQRIVTEYQSAVADGEDQRLVISRMANRTKVIEKHADECYRWQMENVKEREDELADIRGARQQDIIRRLKELGWEEEINKMTTYSRYSFMRHKHMGVSKKLTDRGWEKIKDDLVRYMEDARSARLHQPYLHGFGGFYGPPYGIDYDDYDSEELAEMEDEMMFGDMFGDMWESDDEYDDYEEENPGGCIIA